MEVRWKWCAGILAVLLPVWAQAQEGPEAGYVVSKASVVDEVCLSTLMRLHDAGEESLDSPQLEQFKQHLRTCGWPSVPSAGRQGVDAARDLLLRAGAEGDFQEQIIDLIQSRVGVDMDAFGYAWLNDRIQVQHGRPQQFGTLVAVQDGKVRLSPAPESTPRFWRDFLGLPSVDEWLEYLQDRLDGGVTLDATVLWPPLAADYRPLTHPELRRLVGKMINDDQDIRGEAIAALRAGDEERRKQLDARVAEVDAGNRAALMEIFLEHGFPTPAMIGRDGVSSVFLLVQHADDDPAFQAHALELAKPLMERRDMSRQQYAMLTDRVLLAREQPQSYGSQYVVEQGKVKLLPLADPENVDARRAQMAMGPLANYLKAIARQHGVSDN